MALVVFFYLLGGVGLLTGFISMPTLTPEQVLGWVYINLAIITIAIRDTRGKDQLK